MFPWIIRFIYFTALPMTFIQLGLKFKSFNESLYLVWLSRVYVWPWAIGTNLFAWVERSRPPFVQSNVLPYSLWIVIAWPNIQRNCFLSTVTIVFPFLWGKCCTVALIGTHSFSIQCDLLFFKEFPAADSSYLKYISPSKGLLGLLKWIYSIVPMEPLIGLSATLILTVRRNWAPIQIFKMIGKLAVWERLRLFGSFILQVPVSTSFDEFTALIINSSLFSCSAAFVFSFRAK